MEADNSPISVKLEVVPSAEIAANDGADETDEDKDIEDEDKEKEDEDKDKEDEDKDKEDENDEDDDDEEEEDDIKVTIEDYTTEKQADKQTIQKQPQQAKQAAPAILEANQHIVDINTLEEKPWRKPGADINDYFNYGFDETSWKQYCDHQKQMKNISNEIAEVRNETYRIPVVGHNDMVHRHNNHYNQIPVVPSVVQPVVMHPSRDQHMRDLSPMVEHQSHNRSRRHERQQHQISPPMHQQPTSGGGSRSGRDHRDISTHRHSRSPHTKERERKHSSGRSRKDSKSRERRRSKSKEVSSKKRRSRSREREDERRSKRHKSSRRA